MAEEPNPQRTAALLVETLRVPALQRGNRVRVIVGGLISIIPFVNFVAWGYLYRIFIDGLNGAPGLVLPLWAEWRTYWSVGLRLFVITLGYLVLIAFAGVAILTIVGSGGVGRATEDSDHRLAQFCGVQHSLAGRLRTLRGGAPDLGGF